MPGEVVSSGSAFSGTTPKSLMKMREARASSAASSTYSSKLADGCAKEFFWGCELNKDKKEIEWSFEEEEEDQDFLVHTLFLRHIVLGTQNKDERNLIEVETKNFNGDLLKIPIAALWKGHDMCQLDLNFSHEIPVTFRLVEGSGPVYISAQHLVEFPNELNESEYTATETDVTDASDEEEEEEEIGGEKKGTKRKNTENLISKKKRGKVDSECTEEDEDEEELDEEESEEESMEDDESDEPESSPEKQPKKGKKGKATPVTKAGKKEKATVVAKGKKGKKGKAK